MYSGVDIVNLDLIEFVLCRSDVFHSDVSVVYILCRDAFQV